MNKLDGYLSRLAQRLDPTALVLCTSEDRAEKWVLQRQDQEDLGLGDNYHLAEQSIRSLLRATEARKK